jgi:hypothetical protein
MDSRVWVASSGVPSGEGLGGLVYARSSPRGAETQALSSAESAESSVRSILWTLGERSSVDLEKGWCPE